MNPILGQNVVLFFYKDGDYQEFLCATECSIVFNTDTKDVRTINDGKWKKTRGQKLSYRVSLNGLIELEGGNPITFWLVENQMQMLHLQFRMIFEQPETALLKLVTGTALINASELTSSSTAFANSSFEFEGDGAPVITDSATVCNATIGLIEIGPGDPDSGYQASVNYTGVTNAARLEYSVDGAPREVIFNPGSNGFFFLSGLSDGSHTITVWAVCESGVDGESNELTFEISGGGAAPACSAPGVPVMSDITATTATATWAAASPAPAGGYFWELLGPLGTVLSSGYTTDLTTDLTGLTDGVEYTFRVKSLCEEGVSESSWQSVEFTAEDPAPPSCNAPTNLVISAITTTTATGSWDAASPVPADGYQWVLIEYPSMTIVQSGNEPGLSVNLTGLTTGTQYDLAVRSICGVGDFSGYITETFTTS